MSGFSGRSRRLRGGRVFGAALFGGAVLLAACSGPQAVLQQASSQVSAASAAPAPEGDAQPSSSGADLPSGADLTGVPSRSPSDAASASAASGTPASNTSGDGEFTIAFAGDVHFAERTADRLAADPSTAFGVAAPGLAAADLTVVNLETAITTTGEPEAKSFTFRAPQSAFDALRDAGVDVASMDNNHGADYGAVGVQDSLAAIAGSGFPVIGFGKDAAAAYAPLHRSINGVDVAIVAASQVRDHTLENFSAGATSPGIANAFDPTLIENVKAAAAGGSTVVVFLHWGTEYEGCPDSNQQQLAGELAAAGATAVIGTHAHVLQGAGWRPDGVYVAYGLGNYLWWRSFGNDQDDNGVLTLTFRAGDVVAATFAPSHLDDTGVPVPATGAEADRINAQWEQVRECADLAATPTR
jgi:poly-gamma-glutamate synthesis protein (capsule biosynthesis protein)